jgi:hypothetical protein
VKYGSAEEAVSRTGGGADPESVEINTIVVSTDREGPIVASHFSAVPQGRKDGPSAGFHQPRNSVLGLPPQATTSTRHSKTRRSFTRNPCGAA